MKTSTGKNINAFEFDNISDFRRYLNKNVDTPNKNSLERNNDRWTGVSNWSKFEEYLDEGNKELTAEMRKHTKYYIDKFEEMFATSTSYEFDVTGEFFDIGAVMVGEPEAWIKAIEVKEDKFIELNIQGTYADNTDLDMVKQNAAKVLAIATTLEKQGLLVRINMIFRSISSYRENRDLVTEATIAVKDYNQGLDYKKFGTLLGVPFFRRGFLRLLEIEYGNECDYGYGRPETNKGDTNLAITEDINALEAQLIKE